MTRRFTIIYLSVAPALFLLSWYISHRMYVEFLQNGVGNMRYEGQERSLMYATVLTLLYLSVFLVIRDLYKKPQR